MYVKALHAKIGELMLEKDFCPQRWQGRSVGARKEMIKRDDRLSISRQAQLLGLSRGSVSYLLRPTSQTDLALMCRIDALH